MPIRTVKQARIVLQFFIKDECSGKIPKAINTEKFIEYIAKKTGWQLDCQVIPENMMSDLRGILLRNEGSKEALMLISEENSHCWKRFTSIKECCHLFLEHDAQVNCDNALEMAQALVLHTSFMPELLPPNGNASREQSVIDFSIPLEELLKNVAEGDSGFTAESNEMEAILAKRNPHGVAETSAIVAAIEIMIPENHRSLLAEKAKKSTLHEIASEWKVPRLILEYRLDGWGITPMKSH